MSGSIKVGGNVIATHTGAQGAGEVTLGTNIRLPASGGIQDSSGNNILTESGGNVSVGNVRLPASGGIKDSAGNNVFTESGGVVTLSDSVKHVIPIVRCWLSSDQSINSGTSTKVAFNIDTPQSGADAYKTAIDTHSFFNATGSTVNGVPSYSFLPTIAGYYFVSFQIGFNVTSAGSYYISEIRKNGGVYSQHFSLWSNITRYSANLSAVVHMNGSSDYFDFIGYIQGNSPVFQASGGTNTYAEMFLIQRD
jgi:hypothetical protein